MGDERQGEERVSGASSADAGGLDGLLGKVLEVGQGLFGALFGALRGQQSSGSSASLSEQDQGGLADLPGAVGDALNGARNSLAGGWQELTRHVGTLPENLGRGDAQTPEEPMSAGVDFGQVDPGHDPDVATAPSEVPEGSWGTGALGDLGRAGQSLTAGSSPAVPVATSVADNAMQGDAGGGGSAADLGRASHDHDLHAGAQPNAGAAGTFPASDLHKERS